MSAKTFSAFIVAGCASILLEKLRVFYVELGSKSAKELVTKGVSIPNQSENVPVENQTKPGTLQVLKQFPSFLKNKTGMVDAFYLAVSVALSYLIHKCTPTIDITISYVAIE